MNGYVNGHTNGYVNGESEYSNGHTPGLSVIVSSRAVIDGQITPATLVCSTPAGKIVDITTRILPQSHFPEGTLYKDHSPHILLPGLVDSHVHLNEPGRTAWEGFYTGTQAAAFGGVTTVIDMPLNAIPPTTTAEAFDEKIEAAEGKCWVDVGFYGGIIPGNAKELKGLVKKGVRGFKGFMIDSGVEEFPAVSSEDIAKAMAQLADEPTTLMFHAEMIPPITASVGDDVQTSMPPLSPSGPLTQYQTFLDSRPAAFETYAIEEVLSMAHLAPNLPLHIVHLSAVQAISRLQDARSKGVKITAETCFHYLSLAAEEIKEGDTRHKCCPPIRAKSNQDGLWDEMLHSSDSVIKTVVSDHSPCTPNLKLLPPHIVGAGSKGRVQQTGQGDFFSAWGGVSSVGLGLPILWTDSKTRGFGILDVVKWCCQNPAKQVGLEHRKGAIAVGMDADITVFDDEGLFESNKASTRETWDSASSQARLLKSSFDLRRLLLGAGVTLGLGFGYLYVTDARSGIYRWLVVPTWQALYSDGEAAHEAGTRMLKLLYRWHINPRERPSFTTDDESGTQDALGVEVFGHELANPLAISAGLDKEGELIDPLYALGPAIVEIGGVTAAPQPGNDKPRVWRIPSQDAMINRYGLNSSGAAHVAQTLKRRVREYAASIGFGVSEEAEDLVLNGDAGVPPGSLENGKLLAVQIAKNKVTPENDISAVRNDYLYCIERLGKYADIIVVNVSSPNTPGLRDLQQVGPLTTLLTAVVSRAANVDRKTKPAVMVKVSPDEDKEIDIKGVCEAVWRSGVDGVIVGNTTKLRPAFTTGALSKKEIDILNEDGGYSGPLTFERTLPLVSRYRRELDKPEISKGNPKPTTPKTIFASGGISSGMDALAVLNAGASIAMVYTAMMYQGTGMLSQMKRDMRELIKEEEP
ncbi:MAG: hypothetical protein M1831_005370 [Alyxoria varia]|nr:MAG: hypothetical protein M1831_005370 [Alyxoria varia]